MENANPISLAEVVSSCDKEPVAFIGTVQPLGCLIVVSLGNLNITAASENVATFLGADGQTILNTKLQSVLGATAARTVSDRVVVATSAEHSQQHGVVESKGKRFQFFSYRIGRDSVGIELIPIETVTGSATDSLPGGQVVSNLVTQLLKCTDLTTLGQACCSAIRRLTGLERVMLYRFSPIDWHGLVIAEDKSAKSHSFFGHRFPAEDIPKPARDLYLRNQVRFIFDSSAGDQRIITRPTPFSGPIDLSDSKLRGVSLVHMEYLRNMGVTTSFSTAVIVDEKLWGLFACHHSTALGLSLEVQESCAVVAKLFASFGSLIEQKELHRETAVFAPKLFQFIQQIITAPNPADEMFRQGSRALELFGASGMALVRGSAVDIFGMAPPASVCAAIADQICNDKAFEKFANGVLAHESLTELNPDWQELAPIASGMAAILLNSLNSRSVLMLFRPEIVRDIKWGGDPRKNLANRNYAGSVNPRQSFETWTQTVRFRAKPWQTFELEGLVHLRNIVLSGSEKNTALAEAIRRQVLGGDTP